MGLAFFLALTALWIWIAVIDIRYYLIDRLFCLLVVLVFGAYLLIFEEAFWAHFGIGIFYWLLTMILHFLRPRLIGAGDIDLVAAGFFTFGLSYLLIGSFVFLLASIGAYLSYSFMRGKWGLKHGFPLAIAMSVSAIFATYAIIFDLPFSNEYIFERYFL